MDIEFISGDTVAGTCRWASNPSSTKVKNGVKLYHYYPSVPVKAYYGVTFHLTVRDKFLCQNEIASKLNNQNCEKWKIKDVAIVWVCDWLMWRKQMMYTECKIRTLSLGTWRRTQTVSEINGRTVWFRAQVCIWQRQLPFCILYVAADNDLYQPAWCGCNSDCWRGGIC